MTKMNPDVKNLWVDALRSGEFSQGTGLLRDVDNTYCCLGVLCELYIRQSGKTVEWEWDTHREGYYLFGEEEVLPQEVMDWAEVESHMGEIVIDERHTSLTDLNDNGRSFNEIADLIEKQY